MTKEEFLIAFVLARAAAVPDNLNGFDAAAHANNAWEKIQVYKGRK